MLHSYIFCTASHFAAMTTIAYLVVGTLCLLYSVNGEENEVTEYKRSGSCSV